MSELTHAFQFDHGHKKKFLTEQSQRRHNEIQMVRRMRGLMEKEQLAKSFREALQKSTNLKRLEEMLSAAGMKLYRHGNGVGIIKLTNEGKEGRRYRLRTIDVQVDFEEQQRRWQRENEKEKELLQRKKDLTQVMKFSLKQKW